MRGACLFVAENVNVASVVTVVAVPETTPVVADSVSPETHGETKPTRKWHHVVLITPERTNNTTLAHRLGAAYPPSMSQVQPLVGQARDQPPEATSARSTAE